VDKDDEKHALELELHGLDQELKDKRMLHRSLTTAVEYLEAQRLELVYRLKRLQNEAS
jgi:hypothetical protein